MIVAPEHICCVTGCTNFGRPQFGFRLCDHHTFWTTCDKCGVWGHMRIFGRGKLIPPVWPDTDVRYEWWCPPCMLAGDTSDEDDEDDDTSDDSSDGSEMNEEEIEEIDSENENKEEKKEEKKEEN